MDNKKVYILQKDLPYYKAGEELTLNAGYYEMEVKNGYSRYWQWPVDYVENNPDWFKLKGEGNMDSAPFVSKIIEAKDSLWVEIGFSKVTFGDSVWKIMMSKKKLAEMIISESKGKLFNDGDEDVSKQVTYKEYLQFGEDCFNAARKNNSEWYYKFKNFSDYMNSQKPNE